MKKEGRQIYHVLASEVDFGLCAFCKFAEYSGSCCDAGDVECKHPLREKSFDMEQQVEYAQSLGDCWGFRPCHPLSLIADIVGVILQHGWDTAAWWQDKTGRWKIAGSRIV